MNRRKLIDLLTRTLGAALTLIIASPMVQYLMAPASRAAGKKVKVKLLSDLRHLRPGVPHACGYQVRWQDGWIAAVENRRAYVVRGPGQQLTVLSNTCTHAGCGVEVESKDGQTSFICRCHDGKFDLTGKVLAGPPPRPLEKYEPLIENGQLFIEVDT